MSKDNNRPRRFAKWLEKYWWVLPMLFVLQSVVVILVLKCGSCRWIQLLMVAVWLLVLPFLLVQLIALIKGKCWLKSVCSVVIEMVPVGVVGVWLAIKGIKVTWRFVAMILASLLWPFVDPSDGFGKEHFIPEGLEYSIPLNHNTTVKDGEWITHYEEPVIDRTDTASWLQIWNDNEGGRYLYDFSFPALPAGTLFLKCYEVGGNIPLSENVMRRNTSVSCSTTESFTKLVEKREFVIYEGDWGDYYAVRVEVWHKDSETRKEHKLMEKVYLMEGWMR